MNIIAINGSPRVNQNTAKLLKPMENFISGIFRMSVKTHYSYKNYPFVDDWTNYEASDLSDTKKQMDEVFASECEKAFQLGVELASNI